jgi:hypothetical protein
MSPLNRRGEQLGIGRGPHGGRVDAELLEDLEENLDHLTVGILVPHMDDIPLCMQRSVSRCGEPVWEPSAEGCVSSHLL